MILIRKIVGIASTTTVLVSFLLTLYAPKWIVLFALACIGFVLFSFLFMVKRKTKLKEFGGFFTAPFLFLTSGFTFFLLLEGKIWKLVFILGMTVVYGIYTECIFRFFYQPPNYQPYSLENISMYMNILSCFFFLGTAFGLKVFLNTRSWQIFIPLLFIFILLTVQTLWAHKVRVWTNLKMVVAIVIPIIEAFWVVRFFPTSHLIDALLVASVFYLMIQCGKLSLMNSLTKTEVKRYLALTLGIIFIALTTARWS